MRWLWLWMMVTLVIIGSIVAIPKEGSASESVVYSIYRELDLGNPGENPQKDFYVNMGTAQGVHTGSVLEVARRVPTYDLVNEKLFKDIIFPIARIKVIHAEENAAVARLEKLLPADSTPAISPRGVMVGDLVKPVR